MAAITTVVVIMAAIAVGTTAVTEAAAITAATGVAITTAIEVAITVVTEAVTTADIEAGIMADTGVATTEITTDLIRYILRIRYISPTRYINLITHTTDTIRTIARGQARSSVSVLVSTAIRY